MIKPEPAPAEVRASEQAKPIMRTRMRFTDWLDTAEEVKTPNVPFESVGQGDAQDWVRAPRPDAVSQPTERTPASSGTDPELPAGQPPPTAPASPARTRDTIDRFLRSAAPEPARRTEFFTPQEAGRRSLHEQADMMTETLARIYEQQGNFAKAAEAYRKLALKVPEKAAYFAALSQAAAEKQKKEG
ncbi:MAG: tetratricopeptide repeat protein [Flavobacteriales bacterium]